MNDTHPAWIQDTTPRLHQAARIILFLTSFSWTFNPVQDYMGESTPVEKIVTRMLPMALVAVYCILLPHRNTLIKLFRPRLWTLFWYVILGVFCGISGIQPALCAWKGAEILITLMWICVSCRDAESTKREFIAILRYVEILLWATVFLAIVNPSAGFRPSLSGLPWIQGYLPILNPNTIGFLSVLAMTRLIFLPAKYKPLRVAVISFTLLCAQSRTSYGVMMVALAFFVIDGLRQKKIGRVVATMFAGLVFLGLTVGWMDSLIRIFMRGETVEEMSSLSGRTNYWDFAFAHISWLGNGLATGSRSLIFLDSDPFQHGSVNMHNSYIEALIGAGYVGALPFLITIVWRIPRMFIKSLRSPDFSEAIFAVCAVVFVARSMTSIVLAIFSFDFMLLMICWAWIWAPKQENNDNPVQEVSAPKPVVYEKPLSEQ